MKCRLLTSILALLALVATSACADPADAVATGKICLPATEDCPDHIDLHRPGTGRNSMEITLRNQGDSSTPNLRITTSSDLELPRARPRTSEGHIILVDRDLPIGPDEILHEGFGPHDLTVAQDLHLQARCNTGECNYSAEYLFFSESIECFDDGVCSRGEICEVVYGRCAECSTESHCSSHQVCDLQTGSCFPGGGTGCAHSASETPSFPLIFVTLIALGLLFARRRQILRGAVLPTLILLALTALPSSAWAEARASMSAGGGPRVLTGEAGQHTRLGWGIAVHQQVRWRSIGANLQLSTHYFAMRDEHIPREARLSGYGVAIGPRVFLPVPIPTDLLGANRALEAFIAVDYTRWGVSENRIAHATGLDLSFNALGPTVGIFWRWSGLKVTAQSNYSHIFGWPGGIFSAELMVGIGL